MEKPKIWRSEAISSARESCLSVPLSVLQSMSVSNRAAVAVSESSKFSDMFWDFSGRDKMSVCSSLVVDFRRYQLDENCDLLQSFKVLIYSLLVDPPRERLRYATIVKNLKRGGLPNLVRFMIQRRIERFSEITEYDFLEFLAEQSTRATRSGDQATDRTLRVRIIGINWLVSQGEKLVDRLLIQPWFEYETAENWVRQNAKKVVSREELTTEVIPDNIVSLLLKAAIAEVEKSEELTLAVQLIRELPRRPHRVNRSNAAADFLNYRKRLFDISERLRALGFAGGREVLRSFIHFRSAVAILIGLLSGMRPAEILAIPGEWAEACLEETLQINEQEFKCYFICSTLSKNIAQPRLDKWQTLPVVLKAIKKLLLLSTKISESAPPFLFSPARRRIRGEFDYSSRVMSPAVLNTNIKNFAEMKAIDLRGWGGKFSTRCLRRTCARVLTRNGLGLIELQDQLKHYDIEVTRMYGQPAMHYLLSKEKVALSQEIYEELLYGTIPIVGGGAENFGKLRGQFLGLTRISQEKFIQNLAKSAVIDQVEFGLCSYRAERALCGGNKSLCMPDLCENSIIPIETARKVLQDRLRENMRLSNFCKGRKLLEKHLLSEARTIKNLLNQTPFN